MVELIIESQACIERLARAVLGGVLVGRARRPEEFIP
jgi:hypothetical protein